MRASGPEAAPPQPRRLLLLLPSTGQCRPQHARALLLHGLLLSAWACTAALVNGNICQHKHSCDVSIYQPAKQHRSLAGRTATSPRRAHTRAPPGDTPPPAAGIFSPPRSRRAPSARSSRSRHNCPCSPRRTAADIVPAARVSTLRPRVRAGSRAERSASVKRRDEHHSLRGHRAWPWLSAARLGRGCQRAGARLGTELRAAGAGVGATARHFEDIPARRMPAGARTSAAGGTSAQLVTLC